MHGLLKVGTTDCFTLQVKQSLGGTRWDNDTPKPGGGVATYGDPADDQRTSGVVTARGTCGRQGGV